MRPRYAVSLALVLAGAASSRGSRCARSSRLWRHQVAVLARTTEVAGSWSGSARVAGLGPRAHGGGAHRVSVRRDLVGTGAAGSVLEFAVERYRSCSCWAPSRSAWSTTSLGSSADKGFRGHLSALRRGRLTTGALKLLGIGVLAPFAITPDVRCGRRSALGASFGTVGAAGAGNRADREPAQPDGPPPRTGAEVLLGAGGHGVRPASASHRSGPSCPFFAVVSLGPVVAVWGFDLKERGMLGDAGANAAGVMAGWLLVDRAFCLVVGSGGLRALRVRDEHRLGEDLVLGGDLQDTCAQVARWSRHA